MNSIHLIHSVFLVAILVVVVASAVWFGESQCDIAAVKESEFLIEASEFGADSFRSGVPAEANPYIYREDRVAWLKGWVEAKESE